MRKIFIMCLLCLAATFLKEMIFHLFPFIMTTIFINFLGSILFVMVVVFYNDNSNMQKYLNIAFLGSFTTFSGVFKDLFFLIENNQFITSLIYILITFIIIPIVTWFFYHKIKELKYND
ncbi:fluoride ion exporter CrcB/FEX [Bacilli bacterium PM5-3]|nr:fluoride ion exporter CrcB/FEX [Bacilli bacterium PM5-3]MDH6603122.1 fluoride ion exporter CrcB/FEX [Bacilli bacterium PM5-9]